MNHDVHSGVSGRTAVRWGLIGAGDIAVKRVAPALNSLETCIPATVSRANAALLPEFAAQFSFLSWEAEWQRVAESDAVDAVYIATPVHLHARQAIFALERGKHVLCEKPMALDRHEGERMLDAARLHGCRLGIAYYRRFYPVIRRVKKLLESGSIGTPVYASIQNFELFDRQPGEDRYWLLQPERSGGGPLIDMGCHRLELLQYLFGPMDEASGMLKNVRFRREVEDSAVVTLHFAGGMIGSLISLHNAYEPRDTLEIYGTSGSLRIEDLKRGDLKIVSDGSPASIEQHPLSGNAHEPLITDFTEAVLTGRQPAVTGETGLQITALLDLIYGRA